MAIDTFRNVILRRHVQGGGGTNSVGFDGAGRSY
jgi:hypothetical protein